MHSETESIYPHCSVVSRTVNVGGLTKAELIQELQRCGILMNDSAVALFASDRFTTAAARYAVTTVELTVGQLGFAQGATLAEIYHRAGTLGLALCPLELAPHLRLHYRDQPEGWWGQPVRQHQAPPGSITIASEPGADDDEFPKGFYLRRIKGELWLRGYRCGPQHVWDVADHFIFMQQQPTDVQTSYDRVAAEYAARIAGELAHKPLDRHLLRWFAERVQGLGLVCDVGCGPGHVAHFLHEQSVAVCGLDLSLDMVAHAQHRYPDIPFTQGSMRSLPVADAAWGGVVAFYSIIHIPRDEVVAVLREFWRVLRPGGALLLAFHIGDEIVHLDEWWDRSVNLDFVFFRPDEMAAYLASAGFGIEAIIERAPYPAAEHPSRRAYICAGKPV